jgi:hypothetical protein
VLGDNATSDVGSFTMKSMVMDVKGNVKVSDVIGKGGVLGFVGLFFHDWHMVHPLIYFVTICFMFGHQ